MHFILTIILLCGSLLCSSTLQGLTKEGITQNIVADLREPEYCEGVLKTEKGGVVTGPDIRIQAQKIAYTCQRQGETKVCSLEAEGDLILEFGPHLFVGRRLEYDFVANKGFIYDAKTGIEPWFFGGSVIELCADGEYIIRQGFFTTSENGQMDWKLTSETAIVTKDQLLKAKGIKLQLARFPLLYLPSIKVHLNSIFDTPLRYTCRWGGHRGPRIGIKYELFSWQRFKTFIRLDYYLRHGLGLGAETRYLSQDRRASFSTINYIAQDASIVQPHEKLRYRFQGIYRHLLLDDRLNLKLSWDKLSDKYMATDYKDKGLQLDTAIRTELHMRHVTFNQITNFYSRIRVNRFQTVKQELPSLQAKWRPFSFDRTGIISDSQTKISYLDFQYAKHSKLKDFRSKTARSLKRAQNYHSSRLEYSQRFYRPFAIGALTATPMLGGVAIFYGNSPHHYPRYLALGRIGCDCNLRLYRFFERVKHVIIPYVNYNYYTYPTVSPHDHYIFDIEDGLYRLNQLTFGVRQNFYVKDQEGLVNRYFYADLYSHAFFSTRTLPNPLPKAYAKFSFSTLACLRHYLQTAWDFQHHLLDHINFRTEWTVNEDLAVALEYRHRDSFDWRKADSTNFMLESFRKASILRKSSLSDRRDTLLVHLFYRLHPNWAVEFESRQGWNRIREPNYNEFEIDLHATLSSAWHLKCSYRHREDDHRFILNLNVGLKPPNCLRSEPTVPTIDF